MADPADAVAAYLNGAGLGADVYKAVPADRPSEFACVTQTGGSRAAGGVFEASVDVDCWAQERPRAFALADAAARALERMPEELGGVFHVSVSSFYSDPDLDSGTPRYVVGADIVFN